jgi:hypothetical protein
MTKAIDRTTDLTALINTAAAGNEVAVFEALLAQVPTQVVPKSTVAARKASNRQAIESFDLDRLLELQAKMTAIIDTLTANELGSNEVVLSEDKATALMAELLDENDVAELLTVRKEMIREAVFAHLDEVEGPNTNGSIPVPALGKRFSREGAGTGAPQVDEQRLAALLGDRWEDACDEVFVPAQEARIERKLSVEKVLDMAQDNPEILEALRTCLAPGKPRSAKFWVRDL